MGIVESRQQAPKPIYLGIITIDLGGNPEDTTDKHGERKA